MKHRNHRERFLIRRVCDHIRAQRLKAQWLRGEVGTAVSDVGERYKRLNRFVDFLAHAVGCVQAVGSNVFPDFVDVGLCLRVENKSAHEPIRLETILL